MARATSRGATWLPAATLGDARAAQPFVRVVDEWRARWFGTPGDAGGSTWQAATVFVCAGDDDWIVLRPGDAADLAGRPKAVIELAFALLGVRPRTDLADADLQLLRRIAAEALDDLQERIDAVCAAAGPAVANGGPRWRLAIGPATRRLLAIEIAEDALAAIARRTFRPVARSVALSSLREAVGEMPVKCAAYLGRAGLSVQQLGALEPGDIILLDQPVREAVPLAIEGRPCDLRIALADDGATLSLQD